jgi:hypothetical protein
VDTLILLRRGNKIPMGGVRDKLQSRDWRNDIQRLPTWGSTECLCPQLDFDRSIKMPVANSWARGDGVEPLDLCRLGCGREEQTENHYDVMRDWSNLELQKREPTSYVRIWVSGHWSLPWLGPQ